MNFRVSNVVCRCTHRHAHTRRPRPGVRVRVRVRPVVCHGQPSFREVKVSGERETSVTRECCVPTLVVGPDGRGRTRRRGKVRVSEVESTLPYPTSSSLVPRPSFPRRPTRHECHSCVSVGARGGGNGRGRREDSDDKIHHEPTHTHTLRPRRPRRVPPVWWVRLVETFADGRRRGEVESLE